MEAAEEGGTLKSLELYTWLKCYDAGTWFEPGVSKGAQVASCWVFWLQKWMNNVKKYFRKYGLSQLW